MRRLIWGFAGRTYHIVGSLMSRLNYDVATLSDITPCSKIDKKDLVTLCNNFHNKIVYQRCVHYDKTVTFGA